MQYMLLIYGAEADAQAMRPEAVSAMMTEYFQFTNGIRESGHYKSGNPLQPSSTATSVRVRDGKTLTTDGPFAETREQLGGYYLIEAAHLDDAIAIAARIPGARHGTVEVRPIRAMAASA